MVFIAIAFVVALPLAFARNSRRPWLRYAVLTYTPAGLDYRVPAYGYIYRLNGHPLVETPYRENAIKSWVYPVTEDWSPEVTGADAGYLIQNAA